MYEQYSSPYVFNLGKEHIDQTLNNEVLKLAFDTTHEGSKGCFLRKFGFKRLLFKKSVLGHSARYSLKLHKINL